MDNTIEKKMINTAKVNLTKKGRILFPENATVEYPEFDPCKYINIIAVVSMPAIINCREITIKHCIRENDPVY